MQGKKKFVWVGSCVHELALWEMTTDRDGVGLDVSLVRQRHSRWRLSQASSRKNFKMQKKDHSRPCRWEKGLAAQQHVCAQKSACFMQEGLRWSPRYTAVDTEKHVVGRSTRCSYTASLRPALLGALRLRLFRNMHKVRLLNEETACQRVLADRWLSRDPQADGGWTPLSAARNEF